MLPETHQKTELVFLAQKLYANTQKLTIKDLEEYNITAYTIRKLFGSLISLKELAGIPCEYRKPNMADDEIKEYLVKIKKSDDNCCGLKRKNALCFNRCNCWVTDAVCKDKAGRSQFWYKSKQFLLYRVAYIVFKGPIALGMHILHLCDNPSCFNPEHLMQGDDALNAKHREERGRSSPARERRPKHKIKDPYDWKALLEWVMANITVSERGEWLFSGYVDAAGYPRIVICNKVYLLHRLILANTLGVKYEDIKIACHKFPSSLVLKEAPQKHDLNPAHIYNGTQSQNSTDTLDYGKAYSLSRQDVSYIFEEANKTDWLVTTAKEFDLRIAKTLDASAKTVCEVRKGNIYKNWHEHNPIMATEVANTRRSRAVIQMTLSGEIIKKYESMAVAARAINTYHSGISKACRGIIENFEGFTWKYENLDGANYD